MKTNSNGPKHFLQEDSEEDLSKSSEDVKDSSPKQENKKEEDEVE